MFFFSGYMTVFVYRCNFDRQLWAELNENDKRIRCNFRHQMPEKKILMKQTHRESFFNVSILYPVHIVHAQFVTLTVDWISHRRNRIPMRERMRERENRRGEREKFLTNINSTRVVPNCSYEQNAFSNCGSSWTPISSVDFW